MIRFLSRFFLFLLLRRARPYGKLIFQQTELETGLGWHCALRWQGEGPHYAWTGVGMSMRAALWATLLEAEESPIQELIGTPCHPKLGTVEFDPEP